MSVFFIKLSDFEEKVWESFGIILLRIIESCTGGHSQICILTLILYIDKLRKNSVTSASQLVFIYCYDSPSKISTNLLAVPNTDEISRKSCWCIARFILSLMAFLSSEIQNEIIIGPL